MKKQIKYIKTFSKLKIKDIPTVGGKNASLGEMFNNLTKQGINLPDGFATTAQAYQYFIEFNDLKKKINDQLQKLDKKDLSNLKLTGKNIRQLILSGDFPQDFAAEIKQAYQDLSKKYNQKNADVAVRSSATAEDLPTASFAGQQESYLNIKGEKELLKAIKKCMASLFTDRAISYRVDQGFKHEKVYLSVGVQKMVRSDKASAGVMFTIDTESGFEDMILINSAWGLGEFVVKGTVSPDEFFVYKPTMQIIKKELGTKKKKLIYSKKAETKEIKNSFKEQNIFSLTDKEILQLAKWGQQIHQYYKKTMDIEWAKDGQQNKLYIVQARPETVKTQSDKNVLKQHILEKKGKVLIQGESIGQKIAAGEAHVIKSVKELHKFKAGQVLVTEMTDPDWEPVMATAAAIVTDSGGRTCHAAIVSRELGIPAVVGTKNGTKQIKNKKEVTVSCAEGENGYVYDGKQPFKVKKTNLKKLPKPPVDLMMNLGDPTKAFSYSFLPNKGIGLARIEFIITSYIKIHPMALLNYKEQKKDIKQKIDQLTLAYSDKKQFYIDQLAYGIAQIGAAFAPNDVIVRFSDFKTNEYANLIGGEQYEPEEANPMLGWRGASRYYDPRFKPAFELECQAIKKVRNDIGLKNVKVMVPFCRTVEEGQQVIKILKENGLKQGDNGLEVYVMVEIPSNIVLADQFAEIFDGFSIGSNDLTQLTLGIDRDSELISKVADERNQAVKNLISQVIKVAQKNKIKIGICGQAPSDFPDFAKFLMKEGINSISLTPDTIIKTTLELGK